ncbi:MAG: UDP-glucose 4-epimerase GalE [Dehalococcoidia bacterium]|jgi:UDP-glucose 4-epimerase
MKILVTGAAGYIGSVVTEQLVKERHDVVALDNLANGHREAVTPEAIFVKANLADLDRLDKIFKNHDFEAVIHLAAESQVAESGREPNKYFHANLLCSIHLLDKMMKYHVNKLIFSSTAAIYGSPDSTPITETQPIIPPLNTYGESKLMLERILQRYSSANGLRHIALRFFNAAGASEEHGEDHNPESHLIPIILKVALGQKDHVDLYGTDYPTSDGTCVRDYIHVSDIARAHITALNKLGNGKVNKAYNLGTRNGFSVRQVIEAAKVVTGEKITTVNHSRRHGDPAILVADSSLAKSELDWEPEYTQIDAIVETAWKWQREHPSGYRN